MSVVKRMRIVAYHYSIFLKQLSFVMQWRVLAKIMCARNKPFRTVEIGLTYACQLDCVHCGVAGQRNDINKELSTAEVKACIDLFHKLGGYFVVLAGAEPLMRSDCVEIVAYAARTAMVCAVSTNGLGLTPEKIRQFKKAGLAFFNISLDGSTAQTHDASRNHPGCFVQVEKAIAACCDERVSVIVSTYATKANIANGGLRATIAHARKMRVRGVRILFAVPSGKWMGCAERQFTHQEKEYVRQLLDPEFVYVEGVCNQFTECNSLLKKLFYISPYGDIQPCSFVPLSFGNIRRSGLATVLQRMRSHDLFNGFDTSDCLMRNSVIREKYFSETTRKPNRLIEV